MDFLQDFLEQYCNGHRLPTSLSLYSNEMVLKAWWLTTLNSGDVHRPCHPFCCSIDSTKIGRFRSVHLDIHIGMFFHLKMALSENGYFKFSCFVIVKIVIILPLNAAIFLGAKAIFQLSPSFSDNSAPPIFCYISHNFIPWRLGHWAKADDEFKAEEIAKERMCITCCCMGLWNCHLIAENDNDHQMFGYRIYGHAISSSCGQRHMNDFKCMNNEEINQEIWSVLMFSA